MKSQKIDTLISDLRNGDLHQRRIASYKLRKYKDKSAVTALIDAYKDTDDSVRRNVNYGLSKTKSKEALDFLKSQGILLPLRDPFSETLNKATVQGGVAGLAGELMGLLIGFPLFLTLTNCWNATGLIYGGIATIVYFFCTPYFLVGAGVGALLGRFWIRLGDESENSRALLNAKYYGVIAGFATGFIPFLILGIYSLFTYGTHGC